jgi:hypothetical protein
MKPLLVADVFDRLVGALDAGVEEDEEIDPADRDDPEKVESERAELGQRIERRPNSRSNGRSISSNPRLNKLHAKPITSAPIPAQSASP